MRYGALETPRLVVALACERKFRSFHSQQHVFSRYLVLSFYTVVRWAASVSVGAEKGPLKGV